MADTEVLSQKTVEMPAPTPNKPLVRRASIETINENLEQAKICKQEGNALYNDGQIKPAIRKYHQCLLHLRACQARYDMPQLGPGGLGLDKEVQDVVDKVQAECYNNLAACLLKQPKCDYNRVVQYSNKVLCLQPNNVKAMFRKAVAHYNMGNYRVAHTYLNDAVKMRKGPDSLMKKYLELCAEAESSSNKK
uniref:Tetratricopeptide repeat protein 9C n=1 Tax=Rhipicephalus zambeziensis TaxID=60191 RepID=A0A224Z0N6_9ACAR